MMKNYIQQIIELFGHNEYSLATRRKVQRWLADYNHAEEKKKHFTRCGNKRENRKYLAECNSPYYGCNKIWECSLSVPVKSISYLYGEQQLFPVGSIVCFYLSDVGERQTAKDLVECFIPTAEIRELTLPDGTRVMLNSRSTLLYPEQFAGKTRSVYLIGEANFQVKPDEKHPFIVKANDFQITALGTEFNVNAYPENNELIATLLEGSVKVEFNNLISNVILKPNEQITYNKQTRKRSLQSPRIEDVTAWQRGELVFSDMHLDEIFTSLERKFPYTFVYSLHSLNNKSYSFRFQQQATLEEVMKIITQVAGDVKYIIKGNKCYITDKI